MMALNAFSFILCLTVTAGLREQVEVTGQHAQGLEAEHHFEVVSKGTRETSGSAWAVTKNDEKIIAQLLKKLNAPGADSKFTWKDDQDHWTFGLVQLTAQTAKGSLVLHMLHRHGLASLLASRAASQFSHLAVASDESATWENLEQYVQTAEEYAEIRELRELLMGLSLSGLRNLHSFDHQWSVNKFAGRVPGCTQRNAGDCILQAGRSKRAYDFLVSHGFGPKANKEVSGRFEQVMSSLQTGRSGLGGSTYQNFLTPGHTGQKNFDEMRLTRSGRFFWLQGNVYWEGGGVSQGLQIPITLETYNQIRAASFNASLALKEAELQKYVEGHTHAHKVFMAEHRLAIWTHETTEFSEMYPRYAKVKGAWGQFLAGMFG